MEGTHAMECRRPLTMVLQDMPSQANLRSTKKTAVENAPTFDTTGTAQELGVRIAALKQVVTNAHSQQTRLSKEQAALLLELDPLSKAFAPLFKKTCEINDQLQKQGIERMRSVSAERKIVMQEEAIDKLMTVIGKKMHDDFSDDFVEFTRRLRLPVEAELEAQKATCVTLIEASNDKSKKLRLALNPILLEQKALSQKIDPLMHEKEKNSLQLAHLSETEKKATDEMNCLWSALNHQLTDLMQKKVKLQDSLAALKALINEEKDVDTKINLRERLIGTQRTMTETCQAIKEIEELTQEPVQAKSFLSWFSIT